MYHKLVDVTTSCGPTAAPQCGESAPLACTRWFWGFMRPIGQLPRLHLFGVWFDTPVFAAASWQFCLVFLLRRSSCRKRERTVGAWAAPITRPAATTSRFGTRASQVKSPALPWLVSIHDSLDPMTRLAPPGELLQTLEQHLWLRPCQTQPRGFSERS